MDFIRSFGLTVDYKKLLWHIGDECPWRHFTEKKGGNPMAVAECAGIRVAKPSKAAQLQELLYRMLPESKQGKLGCAKNIEFEIELEPGVVPVSHRIRRQPPAVLQDYRDMTKELLDLGIIEKCASPWSSATVLVKRNGKKRLCID